LDYILGDERMNKLFKKIKEYDRAISNGKRKITKKVLSSFKLISKYFKLELNYNSIYD
jgi:hypothetical protein